MEKNRIGFVAHFQQDNLGIGYVASVLLEHDYKIALIDLAEGTQNILEQLRRIDPLLVGFSIIFQYQIHEFKNLISLLRQNGIKSHFTAGGHYPSLRCRELMNYIPELDSIVLFEGEFTLLELAQKLRKNSDWSNTPGLARRNSADIVVNQLRPLEENLDNFPIPVRKPQKPEILNKKVVTILAGRGCYYNCSFCSIRQFYSVPPGPVKRIRKPEFVAQEMKLLYRQEGCEVFLFQDDDFPVAGKIGSAWVEEFCEHLKNKGLSQKVLWKISCRANEVEEELFKKLKSHGMLLTYIGIESGTDEGLQRMNKRTTLEMNSNAVNILKRLNIYYEFGFMLFDPSSTFESILMNLLFLEQICGDGSAALPLSKMLPLAETQIEKELRNSNRLFGKPAYEDYYFYDPHLNDYFEVLSDMFNEWMYLDEGLLTLTRWIRFHLAVYKWFYDRPDGQSQIEGDILAAVSQINLYFIKVARELAYSFQSSNSSFVSATIDKFRTDVEQHHEKFKTHLFDVIAKIKDLSHVNLTLENMDMLPVKKLI